MKTIEVTVTLKFTLEIAEQNDIVREYESEKDLLWDCATYDFGSGLPVIGEGGVKVKDRELIDVEVD